MARRGQQNYSQVRNRAEEEEGDEEGSFVNNTRRNTNSSNESSDPPSSSSNNRTGRTRNRYNRLSTDGDDGPEAEAHDEEQGLAAVGGGSSNPHEAAVGSNNNNNASNEAASTADSMTEASSLLDEDDDGEEGWDVENDDGRRIHLVILDVAQKKFKVSLHPQASVKSLKRAGAKVHKVSPDRQRLIFRGKMLQDDEETLEDVGITADETIIHLFPKPKVIIKQQQEDASQTNEQEGGDGEDGDGGDDDGARVPTIVLDAEEAERRSQILVLGSTDYLEAQNNVKLFSFMLLIISSIELMNLLALALGVPQDTSDTTMVTPSDEYTVTIDDDIFGTGGGGSSSSSNPTDDAWLETNMTGNATSASSSSEDYLNTWTTANWFDLAISVMGVYVGVLGLQATTHNTLRLAKLYLTGTVLTGIGWMIFNFIMTLDLDKQAEKKREEDPSITDDYLLMDNSDIRWQALSVMVLPGMVWILCCLRAWQFQQLLFEAEQEAEERIRSEFATVVRNAGENGGSGSGEGDAQAEDGGAPPDHDEELALQNQTARIT